MKDIFLTRTLLSLTLLVSGQLAAAEANLEYKIKAGYLYNFTKFIVWPETKNLTFNLCILGQDPFGAVIDPIENKTAFGRPIKIIRRSEDDYLKAASADIDCQIIYLGGIDNTRPVLNKIQSSPQQAGILTVGESQDASDPEKMINFVNRDGKIKLQVNL